jgi:hypothetical protein
MPLPNWLGIAGLPLWTAYEVLLRRTRFCCCSVGSACARECARADARQESRDRVPRVASMERAVPEN